MLNKYHIKDGYTPNNVTVTMDHVSGENYWEKKRVLVSRYYQYHVYKYASKLIKEKNIKAIADVGCGPGIKLAMIQKALPDLSITGIDQPHPIEYCQNNYKFGNWIVDDFENPGLVPPPEGYGLIICADVIEHLQDPDKLLSYIRGLCNAETLIIISTPERDFTRGTGIMHCPQSQHIREWNMDELKSYVQHSGFEVMEQFCVPAYKLAFNKSLVQQEITRMRSGLPRKNNQILVLKKK